MNEKAIIRVGDGGIEITDFDSMQRFCGAAVQSRMFRGVSSVAQAIMTVELGLEIGVKPITAMRNIYYFDGQFCLSAMLINALIKRAGYRMNIIHRTKTGCKIEFIYPGGKCAGFSEYTKEDATDAKLIGRDNWRKHPKSMYYARALTSGARMYCAEVFLGGVYTVEEIQSGESGAGREEVEELIASVDSTTIAREEHSHGEEAAARVAQDLDESYERHMEEAIPESPTISTIAETSQRTVGKLKEKIKNGNGKPRKRGRPRKKVQSQQEEVQ
jgi:hypothetical protein